MRRRYLLISLIAILSVVFRVPILRAVTASYNSTVQIVDSAGNVINGTASAISASYNSTVRVVDSTGHVIDSFGGAPSGAAGGDLGGTYPNPSVVSATGANGLFPINNSTTSIGSAEVDPAATPTGLTVTPTGGTATQYCYQVSCMSNGLATAQDAEVCDAAGPTTLSGTHFETVAVTFPQNGCDHMQFAGNQTGAEAFGNAGSSICPGGTGCIAAAGGVISFKDTGAVTFGVAVNGSDETGAMDIGPAPLVLSGSQGNVGSFPSKYQLDADTDNDVLRLNAPAGSTDDFSVNGVDILTIDSHSVTVNNGATLQSYPSTAPTITAGCLGSGDGLVPGSTNNRGQIFTGSSAATSCTITWSADGVWNSPPFCVFTDANASITPVAYSTGACGTATCVVDFVSASSKSINYVCL